MTGKLSARLRPHAEAAPWVIEAVVRLEQEVERLRAEVERERAAVVAWLRDCDTHCREHDGRENAVSATYRIAANDIERGEHLMEKEPLVGFDGTPVKFVMIEGPSGLFIGTDKLVISKLTKAKSSKKKVK